jgi:hypothetical protein
MSIFYKTNFLKRTLCHSKKPQRATKMPVGNRLGGIAFTQLTV